MSGKVLIAEELRDLLGTDPVPGCEVEWIGADAPTPRGEEYVAVVPLLSRWIGGEQLKGLPNVTIVANCAVGVDNIDLVAAELRNVVVTNTPDVLTESTADLTWALILAVTRRLKEGLRLAGGGSWTGWHPTQLLGTELRERTLGILGAGRIGQAVGRRAPAFGMRVAYAARSRKEAFERETGARRLDLRALLAESDVLSIHLPSTPTTRGLLNRERFAQLKDGAFLVNTARGDVVREPALIEALEGGRLAGAGLDVFAEEPVIPQALIDHPRVVTLPHLGSATVETRTAMARLAVENVRRVLAGEQAVSRVC